VANSQEDTRRVLVMKSSNVNLDRRITQKNGSLIRSKLYQPDLRTRSIDGICDLVFDTIC
jgi:hypothetical protein